MSAFWLGFCFLWLPLSSKFPVAHDRQAVKVAVASKRLNPQASSSQLMWLLGSNLVGRFQWHWFVWGLLGALHFSVPMEQVRSCICDCNRNSALLSQHQLHGGIQSLWSALARCHLSSMRKKTLLWLLVWKSESTTIYWLQGSSNMLLPSLKWSTQI